MNKSAILVGLGDFYFNNQTGYSNLKFTLKNIDDLAEKLNIQSWEVNPPLCNSTANKTTILAKLGEAIEESRIGGNKDDWMLFYFTGHASRYWTVRDNALFPVTYCVTYNENLRFDRLPKLSEFFSQIDYSKIISLFRETNPRGHLITILDCCYAFGLIEEFASQQDYHTIIAAASENKQAAFTTNSTFFTAFKQCWNLPFDQLSNKLKKLMINMHSPNTAKVHIAERFISNTL